jgi:hypothetical protein
VTVSIEFVGGPIDGRVITIQRVSPKYRIPYFNAELANIFLEPEDEELHNINVQYLLYELEIGKGGIAIVNRAGHYRYKYVGLRNSERDGWSD